MIKKYAIFSILIAVVVTVIFLQMDNKQLDKNVIVSEVVSNHPSIFVSKQELYNYLSKLTEPTKLKSKINSGVVPHHLLAGHMIGHFMESVAVIQKPGIIILVGPNHHNQGARIITGLDNWQTPDGLMETEKVIVSTLLQKGLAVRDEDTLSQEHSIGTIVPFIKHFLPETRIVPLILHHDVTLKEVESLLDVLEKHLDEEDFILASVDFSHYLTRQEAEAMDEVTLETIQKFDYNTLFHMGNDNLDSPASLAMVLRNTERKGNKEFQILDHTNSGIILKNDLIETTSYFTLVFGKDFKF